MTSDGLNLGLNMPNGETSPIKELETHFIGKGEVSGFTFTQIRRNDKAYLYRVTSSESIWYEIFERRVNTRHNNISYPSSKAFGKWAYSCESLSKAEEYYLKW